MKRCSLWSTAAGVLGSALAAMMVSCGGDDGDGGSATSFTCKVNGVVRNLSGISYVHTPEGGIAISAGFDGNSLRIVLNSMQVKTYGRNEAHAVLTIDRVGYVAGATFDAVAPGSHIAVTIENISNGQLSGTFEIIAGSIATDTVQIISITDGRFDNVTEL